MIGYAHDNSPYTLVTDGHYVTEPFPITFRDVTILGDNLRYVIKPGYPGGTSTGDSFVTAFG
jgi:hypothetical protein